MDPSSPDLTIPYQELVNSLPDLIFILNEDQVLFMNSAAQSFVAGLGRKPILNTAIHEMLPELPELKLTSAEFKIAQITFEREGKVRIFEGCRKPLNEPAFHFSGSLLILKEITAQKQVERSLSSERNVINTILNTMEALLVVIDRRGRIVRLNRASERFFGYTKEELKHKRVWDLIKTQANQTTQEISANLQAGLDPFQSISHWVTRTGEQKTIAWSSAVIRDERDGTSYIVALGIDMTERERIEELLKRERTLLRHLIDSIPDLIFYKDPSGVYLGWNKAFRTFRGTQTDALQQRLTDADLYPVEKVQQFEETDRQVIESGQPVIYENWTTDAQGSPILLETKKTPYYDPNGVLAGVIGIGRDITRHRVLENELRAANLEIEQLIASLSSAFIAVTTDLRVTRWNPKAEMIFGIAAEEALGQALGNLGLSWEWEKVSPAISRCLAEARAVFMDPVHFRRQEDREGYLGINVSPITNNDKTIRGFILLLNDITERKKAEDQAAQSQKLESIGQLAAGIAHEINTPIQYVDTNTRFLQKSFLGMKEVIQGYQEIFKEAHFGKVDPEIILKVETLEEIVDFEFLIQEIPSAITQTLDGIQRVTEIVQAMKGFSHPGVNKKIPVNLNKALLDTLTVARSTWKYVADVETDLASDLPEVICQPGEINQVFLNIIVNAADAISEITQKDPSRKGLIRLSTRLDGEAVEVRISDNGPGIPYEVRQRIFEPFFTTKEVGKGTGQGLAIAYDIVENKHGGSLTFETELGMGTTFIVRLPIQSSEANRNE